MKLLAGLTLVYGLGVAMLVPFVGEGSGLNPFSAAWAGPNCDADGDGYEKVHPKCGNELIDDLDDSNPCDPDPLALACESGGGGGGGGGDLGAAISMDCYLDGTSGETINSGETIKGDGLNDFYADAVDKVKCSIDGPSTPWPIRLVMGDKGKPENSVRKVDVVLGDFEMGDFNVPEGTDYTYYLKDLYPNLFAEATSHDLDKMEPIRLNVRPYRNDSEQSAEGIHLIPWRAEPYDMGLRFSFPGTKRFSISVAGKHYPENESFTGIGCETGQEAAILANSPDGVMKDASVYLWRDGVDADDLPDGYTVTTGEIEHEEDTPIPEGLPYNIKPGYRWGAVCSSIGPETCGNPRAPSNCNFLGYVKVQFTMHTYVK